MSAVMTVNDHYKKLLKLTKQLNKMDLDRRKEDEKQKKEANKQKEELIAREEAVESELDSSVKEWQTIKNLTPIDNSQNSVLLLGWNRFQVTANAIATTCASAAKVVSTVASSFTSS